MEVRVFSDSVGCEDRPRTFTLPWHTALHPGGPSALGTIALLTSTCEGGVLIRAQSPQESG